MQNLLPFISAPEQSEPSNDPMPQQRDLGQYFTPRWAAEELVERFIESERPESLVEPSCGDGSFLASIPDSLPACGVEIDPFFAKRARDVSGRTVFEGAFQSISRDQYASVGIEEPSHYIGNPPFSLKLISEFLEVIYRNSGRFATCGFILPAYVFQTPMWMHPHPLRLYENQSTSITPNATRSQQRRWCGLHLTPCSALSVLSGEDGRG